MGGFGTELWGFYEKSVDFACLSVRILRCRVHPSHPLRTSQLVSSLPQTGHWPILTIDPYEKVNFQKSCCLAYFSNASKWSFGNNI